METSFPPEEEASFTGALDFLAGFALMAVAFLALAAVERVDFAMVIEKSLVGCDWVDGGGG